MKRINYLVLAILYILSGCVSEEKKDNTISLSGAFALYPMTIKWTEEYKKLHPEVRFNISAGGAGKGMADALAGTVDLGMFSRKIVQEEINQGVWWVGLCEDAVIPTISVDNPYLLSIQERGLNQNEFTDIFITGNISTWKELIPLAGSEEIHVYTRSDGCGAAGTWAEYLGGIQEDLKGVGIHGDPGLADAVARDKIGLGYNNTAYVYDISTGKKHPGIEVIPIDLNGDGRIESEENFYGHFEELLGAIATGIYPSPPARELYFVSNGKPKKQAVIDFIKWTLNEGQKYVTEAGYVPISQSLIDSYLLKLN